MASLPVPNGDAYYRGSTRNLLNAGGKWKSKLRHRVFGKMILSRLSDVGDHRNESALLSFVRFILDRKEPNLTFTGALQLY